MFQINGISMIVLFFFFNYVALSSPFSSPTLPFPSLS